MASMELSVRQENWPMRTPFRIAGHEFTHAELVVVELHDEAHRGRGEACGVYYRGDGRQRMMEQVQSVAREIREGTDRVALQALLPACGARNALDCALWELEAQRAGSPVWQLAGLETVHPLPTVFTIGLDTPEAMAARALEMTHATALKLKLAGDGVDDARLVAVRTARPDVWLGVDANRGFTVHSLGRLLPMFAEVGVSLIEQPLPVGCEDDMRSIDTRIPLAADESVQDIPDLARLVGLFDIVNIKLDKCGGLTRALAMAAEARRLGFRVMVGNMTGTSWSQAPAFVLGQHCDYCDLDGPTFLAVDRTPAVFYSEGLVHCTDEVWGM